MKFRNPKSGEEFDCIEKARQFFCDQIEPEVCKACLINSNNNSDGAFCEKYCADNPADAARLMGYEVIEGRSCYNCKNYKGNAVCGLTGLDVPIFPEEGCPHWIKKEDNMEKKDGLYAKYEVKKAGTGEPVEDCFVLRPDKDPAAVAALRAYARATANKALADDIADWLGFVNKDKPRLAEVLGIETGEHIEVKGFVGEFWVDPDGLPMATEGSSSWVAAILEAINHPESIIRAPRLTEAELERCRVYGVKYLARDRDSAYVTLHTEKPTVISPGYYGEGSYIGHIDVVLFPSVDPGVCIYVGEAAE